VSTLTPERIAQYAYDAGFRGSALTTAVAIALAESAGKPHAHNATPPDDSYGLWQINMLGSLGPARRHQFHLGSDAELFNPAVNAKAAYAISGNGTSFRAWSTYLNGSYKGHLGAAGRAAQQVGAHGHHGPGHPHHTGQPHHTGHSHHTGHPQHGGHRVVLDLAELSRLATLFQHCADRVEHTRRALQGLAGDLEPARARLADTALATLIGDLFASADAPTGLARAAERLDRQGRYAESVRQLAERADGGDGRWSAADATRFVGTIGKKVDPFERAVLEAVVGGRIVASAVHSGHKAHGPLPPAGVDGLTNGRVPPSRLTPVGEGRRMTKTAGAQFRRMDAAANAVGIDLKVNSGYRTYAEQAVLYNDYVHGRGNLAAPPGRSNHGLGLSADIDVTDKRVGTWLHKHAARYGFVNDVPQEPWHWTYRPR